VETLIAEAKAVRVGSTIGVADVASLHHDRWRAITDQLQARAARRLRLGLLPGCEYSTCLRVGGIECLERQFGPCDLHRCSKYGSRTEERQEAVLRPELQGHGDLIVRELV